MFVEAVEKAVAFTRAIHTAICYYGSTEVHPSAATLFFVNSEGWALTCRHVAEILLAGNSIAARNDDFKKEVTAVRGSEDEKERLREIEAKYGLDPESAYLLSNNLIDCVDALEGFEGYSHPYIDAALIRLNGFHTLCCNSFPVFAKDGSQLKQGKFLCRLGFPFAEFENAVYNAATESIEWTGTGRVDSPRFPIEGICSAFEGGAT